MIKTRRLRQSNIALLGALSVLAPGGGAPAAPPDGETPRDATVEERLKAQDKRILELERRLEEKSFAGAPEKAAAPAAPPPEVRPDDIRRDQHHVATAEELASSTFPGSWPMFGTDYRMRFGGYFKFDALYDFDGTGDKNQFLISQIGVPGTPQDGRQAYFNMLIRETRFNFDVRRDQGGQTQKFFLEMDYFDESSLSPRLRHAYFQSGPLLVGLSWSILTELRAINYMLDFGYGDAIFGGRTLQVRWEQPYDKNWSWVAGIENLSDPAIDSQGAPGVGSSKFPVAAGRMTYADSSTLVTFGGQVQQLRWDGEGVGPTATAPAWAAIAGGRQYFGPQRHYAVWSVAYGDGAGGNTAALGGQKTNATLLPDGTLQTNRHYNVALGYTHQLTSTLATNLNYAWLKVQQNSRPADAIWNGATAHVNLIWKFSKAALTGIEYMWGQRTNVSGDRGTASRVQASLQYFF